MSTTETTYTAVDFTGAVWFGPFTRLFGLRKAIADHYENDVEDVEVDGDAIRIMEGPDRDFVRSEWTLVATEPEEED